jgi:hypothetical protein
MPNARWRLYLPVIAPVTTVNDAECPVVAFTRKYSGCVSGIYTILPYSFKNGANLSNRT